VNTYYLLPCTCSRKIPVQPHQAGDIVTCACGASLEVPKLSKLKTLEQDDIPAKTKAAQSAWNAGHRLIFIGLVVIIASIVIGILLFRAQSPGPLTPEQTRNLIKNLPPSVTWYIWLDYEKNGLNRRKSVAEVYYEEKQSKHQIYWVLLAIVATSGAALIGTGIVLVNLRKKELGNS
jgi:hypothetical protein